MTKLICTAQQARQADTLAIQQVHIPSLILMEHAALGCFSHLKSRLQKAQSTVIVCGPGNNGADGLAIARLCKDHQIQCSVFLVDPEHLSIDEKIQWEMIQALGIPYTVHLEKGIQSIHQADLIIDALFGNGLDRPIQEPYTTIIQEINASNAFVASIDIASGLQATTGNALGICVHADQTLAIDCLKTGHYRNDGRKYSGRLICLPIGIPDHLHNTLKTALLLETKDIQIPLRDNHSHKGTFGKALMIGGSQSMHGAITMACQACYRSGIGTLTCMIPDCIQKIVGQKMEFAMNLCVPSQDGIFSIEGVETLDQEKSKYDILTLGNGMSRNETTALFVKHALESDRCVLLDADACWALKDQLALLDRDAPVLLTPHLKEMTYLCQKDLKAIQEDPFETVSAFCEAHPQCTLVLKSDFTLIGHQDKLYVWDHANSALAKGGSGDILCGILTGLYGQCRDPLQAAITGVMVHSLCADIKKDPASVMPQDLIEQIPIVFSSLREV